MLVGFKWHRKSKNSSRLKQWAWVGLLIVVMIGGKVARGEYSIWSFETFVCAGFIISLLLLPLGVTFLTTKAIKSSSSCNQTFNWRFASNGVELNTPTMKAQFDWKHFIESKTTPEGVLLYPQVNMFHWLPAESFSTPLGYQKLIEFVKTTLATRESSKAPPPFPIMSDRQEHLDEAASIAEIKIDSVGDFTFPERNKFDSGFGSPKPPWTTFATSEGDPDWIREFRKKALKVFNEKPMPTHWATKDLENIKFDEFRYYLSDGQKPKKSWDDVPDDVKKTFDRLGIPEQERKFLAGVEAQYDSEAAYSNIKAAVSEQGVIFVNSTEGLHKHPEIFKKWFGKVIPTGDNKFSALNSAVFSGGSFIYVHPASK